MAATACAQRLTVAKDDSPTVLSHHVITAPDPAARGQFSVKRLYYGSGTDKNRAEYRDSVTIKTKTVDGSKLASTQDQSRKKYWGFGFDKMPVNGRVWYPEGDGPFPLVLIVHGNHNMKEFSDPGYGYLGEHFASRGMILVSVDENFLNGNMGNENDARGWMLLKHLEAWKQFNDSSGGPFHRKVDMTRIGLMGHSRGGEAVAVAGAFNRLKHYPDDATLAFDFGFGIRALVAIAPIDGQYQPTSRPTPLENYNYLVIHGSHDGDVSSFSGLRQYERIKFTDGKPWFKSAVWMHRANHGQWNTVWENKDNGPRSARQLELDGLISPEEQRQMGKVFMTAFLEATLKDRREYLPLFRDHRVAGSWLPKTMYLTRFQEQSYKALADFQEDIDVTTGSVSGVKLTGDSLGTWKENIIPLRWRGANMGHNGVWLGWNNRVAGDDTTKRGKPASFAVSVPDSVRTAWSLGAQSALVFSLAPTNDVPGPRKAPVDTTKKADSTKKEVAKKPPPPKKPAAKDSTPIDLTVEVVDANGVTARLPLSRYGPVRRPIELQVYRRKGRDTERFANKWELVLQTFVVPVSDLKQAEPRLDPSSIRSVRFVFDRTVAGTVILSDLGVANIDPAFLTPSVTAAAP
jgi:hypothetical protein